ncbi:hypothetical protein ABIC64_001292 [Plantibacter flavus]
MMPQVIKVPRSRIHSFVSRTVRSVMWSVCRKRSLLAGCRAQRTRLKLIFDVICPKSLFPRTPKR